MKRKFSFISFLVLLLLPLAVGFLSYYVTKDNMMLYDTIVKPPLAPPAWLFMVVWTVLYILMGVSSYLVYQKANRLGPLFIYFLSLFANFFWSVVFFNWRQFGFSFIWLVLLWILILFTIIDYFKVSKPAAILQIPYLLWVTFAGYLNFSIWMLNK